MAFCPNCGAQAEGRFCAKCGRTLAPAGEPAGQPAGSGAAYGTAPGPAPSAPQAAGMSDNVAGALCYVLGFITGILFLVLEPYNRNKFVRFHAFQSIFFNVAVWVFFIVESIVGAMMPFGLGFVLAGLSMLLVIAVVGVWVLLLVKAYQGERFRLPVIGELAEKQA